jgi:hypothetical protein
MKFITYLVCLILVFSLSACADGAEDSKPSVVIGTADVATCTAEGVCTEAEKASWLAVKRAQCLRLGGAYCLQR